MAYIYSVVDEIKNTVSHCVSILDFMSAWVDPMSSTMKLTIG